VRIVEHAAGSTAAEGDWADQTRRVLTRDLLLRAHVAQPAEGQALQFRALHLNLPLVREIADGFGLDDADRAAVEHDALDGLVQALRAFDAYGDQEFTDFAGPFVEREILRTLQSLGRG
jgi:DNA-directed RNA polymerase specialized sigma subunit